MIETLLATTETGRIYFTVAANDSKVIPFYTETPVFVTIIDSCMGMLELNFRLYISAATESSILQKLHVKRVTSVDIRWQ
jgi:hypothetical protein